MPRQGFWYDVLYAWCLYNYEPTANLNDIEIIMNSIMWLNSDIVVNGNPMLNKKCIARGISLIKPGSGKPCNFRSIGHREFMYGSIERS